MRRHRGPVGLNEVLAAAAVAAVTLSAVLLPRLAGASDSPVADLAVTAGLGVCSVRLLAARRLAWATAYAASSLVWTAVGLAPLLAPDVELAVSRWVFVPHAIVVASLAVLVTGRWALWACWSGLVAATAGAGLSLAPLVAFGLLLLAAAALRRRAADLLAIASAVAGLLLVALDQRVFGDDLAPRTLVTAVDAVLVGLAALVTYALTADQLSRRGFEPTGEPGDVTRWLAKALGSTSVEVAFPDGQGSALDLTGHAVANPAATTPVRDVDGRVIAWLSPSVSPDALGAGSVVNLLAGLGTMARARRRQLDQAAEVSASRSRLQAAAEEETRMLERELDSSVMSRLVAMRELVAGTPYSALAARVDEVRHELVRHARGLDPLAGRSLAQALAAHVERGVTVSIDPSVTDPVVARTAWYVATEALTNAAKHAPGVAVSLSVRSAPGAVEVTVTDRGAGGADPSGTGLVGLADRVEAAGGTLELTSTPAGTKVVVRLPGTGNPVPEQGSPRSSAASGFLGSQA